MHLAPRDLDKLILHGAGFLAQKRYARGLRLNYPEAVALLAAQLLEFIRDGDSVANLMDKGKQLLGLDDVLPGVAGLVHEVQVEGTFPDGTKLVTVHHPICRQAGDVALALYGSGLTRQPLQPLTATGETLAPGATLLLGGDLTLNAGRAAIRLPVINTGDRPIQVGSHYPFFETNPALVFDRAQAFGRRLDIPSGTAVRFEPGETKTVALITIAGEQLVYGGNALTSGPLTPANLALAMARVQAGHFGHEAHPPAEAAP